RRSSPAWAAPPAARPRSPARSTTRRDRRTEQRAYPCKEGSARKGPRCNLFIDLADRCILRIDDQGGAGHDAVVGGRFVAPAPGGDRAAAPSPLRRGGGRSRREPAGAVAGAPAPRAVARHDAVPTQ